MRALGGGELLLNPFSLPVTGFVDYSDHLQFLIPLLKEQPYISDVKLWGNVESGICNLDKFRDFVGCFSENICDCHLKAFDIPTEQRDTKWLVVQKNDNLKDKILFCRSGRWQSFSSFWPTMYSFFRDEACFVGLDSEHAEFETLFGKIEHQKTNNSIELASAIAGAKLIVGENGLPLSIAEALKRPIIHGVWKDIPRCIFVRPELITIRQESDLLPFLCKH